MGNILHPQSKLQLPNGLAERREQERQEKIIPLALESEKKTKEAFAAFLEEHNCFFEVQLNYVETISGKRATGQGITFISKLRLPEEEQKVQ